MGQPIEGLLVAGGIAFGELLGLTLEAQRPSRRPMSFMFGKATSFNQPLNKWDVSKVIDMEGRKERIVDKYGEISNWDVSNVTDMEGMFGCANSFNQPLNNWNVSM
jgi:surface protein